MTSSASIFSLWNNPNYSSLSGYSCVAGNDDPFITKDEHEIAGNLIKNPQIMQNEHVFFKNMLFLHSHGGLLGEWACFDRFHAQNVLFVIKWACFLGFYACPEGKIRIYQGIAAVLILAYPCRMVSLRKLWWGVRYYQAARYLFSVPGGEGVSIRIIVDHQVFRCCAGWKVLSESK